MAVRADLGMVFQEGALFDSLTVRENVGYKLFEELNWPLDKANARVEEVLGFIGLGEFIDRMPSELSGGQRRRVAIARAMAAKPRILLYDEPTTGLDPITALTVDEEIVKLRDLEGVSSILVTHQLRDAFFVAEHTRDPAREGGRLRQGGRAEGGRGRVHHAEGRRDRIRRQRLRAARDVREGPVHPCVSELSVARVKPTAEPYASNTIARLVGTQNRHRRCDGDRPRRCLHLRRRRPGRILLAAVPPEDPLRRRPGSEDRRRDSRRRGRGGQGRRDRASSGSEVEVKLAVKKEMQPRITTESRASIGSLSLLGEPVIDISPASSGTPLKDGDTLPSVRPKGQLSDVAESATQSLGQINAMLKDIRAGKGTVGKLFTDDELYKEINQFVDSAQVVAAASPRRQGHAGPADQGSGGVQLAQHGARQPATR